MKNVYVQSTIGQVYNFDFSAADLSAEAHRAELVGMIARVREQLDAQAGLEAPFESARTAVEKAEAEAHAESADAPSIAAHLKVAAESLTGATKFTGAAKGLIEEIVGVGEYLQKLGS